MPKKIKILFTIPNFDTAGSGKVVYDLVKGLNKQYFEPEICCFHNRGNYFKEIEKLDVKIHLFPFTTPYKPFLSFPLRLFKIYKFFKNQQFDIIHSWHWSSDFSEPLAAKLAGIPYVYTKKAMGWGNKAWRWRSKLSTKIIAINEDMMLQFFSKMKDKTIQIPLGVAIGYFHPLKKTYITPEGLKLNETDFVIITVANLVPVKGIEVLLKAVQQMQDQSIKVFIVGNDTSDYAKRLKSNFNDNNILFLGKQLDVRPYLSNADVFVIPTLDEGRKEGMPIAPLEAMASKRIVIGSRVSGIKDILKTFPDWLFTPSDINGLVSRIMKCMQMTTVERETIANNMRAYVEQELSINNFISEHENLYNQIKRKSVSSNF